MLAQWASDLDPTSNLYQLIPSPRRAALGRFSSAIKEIPAKLAVRLEADKKYKEEKAAYDAAMARTFVEVRIPAYRSGWMDRWRRFEKGDVRILEPGMTFELPVEVR